MGTGTGKTVLKVENVVKKFGGLRALDDLNLTIEEGTVHAIIGPNGAGKSTMLNVCIGQLTPDEGTVTFDGNIITGKAPHEINQAGVSRVFQTPAIFGLELAMCLVQQPKLLLLDEPTAGMARHDTNRTIDILKQIKESGMTKVIIEHDMHVVFSVADRISVLARGHIIAEGTPDEIKGNPVVQEAYLGSDAE